MAPKGLVNGREGNGEGQRRDWRKAVKGLVNGSERVNERQKRG